MGYKVCGIVLALSIIGLLSGEELPVNEMQMKLNEDDSRNTNSNRFSNNDKELATAQPVEASDSKTDKGDCWCGWPMRVEIGGNYTYAWITPSGSQSTQGSLGGLQALFEYRAPHSIYAAAAFAWRDGATTNSIGKRTLQDFNAQERIGYSFPRNARKIQASVFTGIGARYLPEEVTIGSSSVTFDYTEFYVPAGFVFEWPCTQCFSWGCNFQWMPQVFPVVRIFPLGGSRWDLTYQLVNFFVEMPLKFSWLKERIAFIIDPFFEIWHDGRTTAATSAGLALGLPGNTYLFTGVNVNLGVSF